MFMKKLGVAAALMLCAFGASASNFRGADQVYIPAAGHIGGASGTFISDIYVSNLSSDEVDVSVIYQAVGSDGGLGEEFPKAITLRGFERKQFLDVFPTVLNRASGFGQLIFNGCKKDTSCGADTQDIDGVSPNYRNITVQSRIYQLPNPCAGCTAPDQRQTGQLFSGIPWYHFVSSLQSTAGLDKVFVTGITNDANFRANIGAVNASQYSKTTIKFTLYQGTMTNADKKGEATRDLGPLGSISPTGLNDLFQGTFTGSNYFIVIEQTNNEPRNNPPSSCVQGCPAFIAFGSVVDNRSGDATTLEPQYLNPLTDAAIAVIYPSGSGSGKAGVRRSVRH